MQAANASPKGKIDKLDIQILSVPVGQVKNALLILRQNKGVIFAEPDYIANALDTIPNDPFWDFQYNLRIIHAPQGWDLSTGIDSVSIAIVDTGVDLNHPELAEKLLPGIDFVDNDNNPQDENGHGTHVAGIAAAATNNNIGIAGVSWGARILPVRVLDASGNGSYSNVAQGIVWAADQGARVINLSLGGVNPSEVLDAAVNYAVSKGVILVSSSGNWGSEIIFYPAAYPPVIAVGATDSLNQRASFSNYGSEIDIVAPGVDIYSLLPGESYALMSGTSMSAPQVSGLAAILAGIPGNSASKIENEIKASALDLGAPGWDPFFGYGLIQMDQALALALNVKLPTPTPASTPTLLPSATPTVPGSGKSITANALPETGFQPGISSRLPIQPDGKGYQSVGEIWLEIPSLYLRLPIVGVPNENNDWNLTWLGQRAGWLEGSAFPTLSGNSILTAHVWDADNKPGPFYQLKSLEYSDLVRLHAWNLIYTYQVRTNKLITPYSLNSVFQHKTNSWITLMTCEDYDSTRKQYISRRVVQAVLVAVEPETQ